MLKKLYTFLLISLFVTFARSSNAQWSELGGPNSFVTLASPQSSVKAIAVRKVSNSVFVNSRVPNSNFSIDEVGQYYRPNATWYNWPGVAGSSTWNSINDIEIGDSVNGVGNTIVAGCDYSVSSTTPFVKIVSSAGTWQNLGSIPGFGEVEDLYVDNKFKKLYAVGPYYGNVANDYYCAVWNGVNWSELGGNGSLLATTGGTPQCHSVCTDLAGNVYVTTGTTNGIYKFNGSSWSFISYNGQFHGLALKTVADSKGNIYLSGLMQNAANSSSTNQYCVVKYNGVSFSEVGGSNSLPQGAVGSVDCDKDGNVYVAVGGGLISSHVRKYIHGNWYALGGVASFQGNGRIDIVKVDTLGNLLVGGTFKNTSNQYYVANYTKQISSANISKTICQGSVFNFNGKNLTASGTYYDTLVNRYACDSFLTLTLKVNPKSYKTINQTICSGNSFTVGSNTYSTSGNYTINLVNYWGCDSVVTLNLNVLPNSFPTNINTSICEGDSYLVGNNSYSASGVYNVHINNYLGCDSTINLTLTVNPKPSSQNISGSNWVSSGLISNYFVGSISGLSYLWIVQGGVINSGQGTNSINVTWGSSGNYKMSVVLTNAKNCVDTSALIIHAASVGINSLNEDFSFNVFPNPTSGSLTIDMTGSIIQGSYFIIQNALGQVVYKNEINMSVSKFDLTSFSSGVYLIEVFDKKGLLIGQKQFSKN